MNTSTTLTQHIAANCLDKSADAELARLLGHVSDACKEISSLVNRGAVAGVLGAAGSENVQGEDQKKLDIISNQVFIDTLERSACLAGMASEEMPNMYRIPDDFSKGNYLITFDPLDGSSNIDVNGSVGTIFSIMRSQDTEPADSSFLQSGDQQVCAGYCLYSSASMLVLTVGDGVDGFTLDPATDEFILTHPAMSVPAASNEFSINAAYQRHWFEPVRRYVDELQAGTSGVRDKDFNMRWAGSMVGDVHRILMRGGIFMYPGDAKLQAAGKAGKLRLLYEANPMGFIMEQAGGSASTGVKRILEVQPDDLHQRVPVIMGSADEVALVVSYHG